MTKSFTSKVISIILAFLLMIILIPAAAFAEDGTPGTDVTIVTEQGAGGSDDETEEVELGGFMPLSVTTMSAAVPTVSLKVESAGNSSKDGKPIYKLVGHISSDDPIKLIETWISFDNTVIQPIETDTHEVITVTNGATTQAPFNTRIKDKNSATFSAVAGWYMEDDKTTFYITLKSDSSTSAALYNNTYLEFYFRLQEEKTYPDDFNMYSFVIENVNTSASTDDDRAALKVNVVPDAGESTTFNYYQKGLEPSVPGTLTPTLVYDNSKVDPNGGGDLYPEGSGSYALSSALDFVSLNETQISDLKPYGIYWEGNESEGYKLTLHNANIISTLADTNAIKILGSDSPGVTIVLIGENEIKYNIATNKATLVNTTGNITITGDGKLTLDGNDKIQHLINGSLGNVLTITGGATVHGKNTRGGSTTYVIGTSGKLVIDNATVIVEGKSQNIADYGNAASGLKGNGVIIRNNSEVTINGPYGTGIYSDSIAGQTGIEISGSNVTVKDDISGLVNSDARGLYTSLSNISINNSTVSIDGRGATNGRGILVEGDNATVTITGGNTVVKNVVGFGIQASKSSGSVIIGGPVSFVSMGDSSYAFDKEPLGAENGSITFEAEKYLIPGFTVAGGMYLWNTSWDYVLMPKLPVESGKDETYSGYFSINTSTTIDNEALKQYGIHWDSMTNTLTLNNATISTTSNNYSPLRLRVDPVTIFLVGDNKLIHNADGSSKTYNGLEIDNVGTIRPHPAATERPSLTIDSLFEGIESGRTLTIKDCDINIKSKNKGLVMTSTTSQNGYKLALNNANIKIDTSDPTTDSPTMNSCSYDIVNSTIEFVNGGIVTRVDSNDVGVFNSDLLSKYIVGTKDATILDKTVSPGTYVYNGTNFVDASTIGFTITFKNYDDGLIKQQFYGSTETVTYPDPNPIKPRTETSVYNFSGWSLTNGGATIDIGTLKADNTVYAVYTELPRPKVASVEGTEYVSVQKAIADNSGSFTVNLTADSDEDLITIDAGKTVVLELGEKKITGLDPTATIMNSGSLTIRGGTNGEIINHNGSDGVKSLADSTLLIESGTITNGNAAVSTMAGSVTTITGGEFISYDPFESNKYAVRNSGTLTIRGGKFTAGYSALNSHTGGVVVVEGGVFESTDTDGSTVSSYSAASITLLGGYYKCNSSAESKLTYGDVVYGSGMSMSAATLTSGDYAGYYYIVNGASDPVSNLYKMGVEIVGEAPKSFTPGTEFEVNITISSATTQNIGSFDFTLDFDSNYFELKSLTTAIEGDKQINGNSLSLTKKNGEVIVLEPTPITIATAKLKVKSGYTVTANLAKAIGLKKVEVATQPDVEKGFPAVSPLEIDLSSFIVTTSDIDLVDFSGGVTDSIVKFGTDVKFTTLVTEGTSVISVTYSVNGVDAGTLTENGGVYTIEGSKITGNIHIDVETTDNYQVTFVAGTGGSLSGTTTIRINKDSYVSEAQLNEVTIIAADGYDFKEWQVNGVKAEPTTYKITEETEFIAIFELLQRTITYPGGSKTGTYGTEVEFTPKETGKIITGVEYYLNGASSVRITLAANSDGTYTIPGDVILDDITVVATGTVDGTMDFILANDYKALKAGTKILVLDTVELTGNNYKLTDSTSDFYWSEKYGTNGAYVCIVADTATEEILASKLTTVSGKATSILYGGNVDGDIINKPVTASDALIINNILHNTNASTKDLYRFGADANGDKKVTTADIIYTLRVAVNLPGISEE